MYLVGLLAPQPRRRLFGELNHAAIVRLDTMTVVDLAGPQHIYSKSSDLI